MDYDGEDLSMLMILPKKNNIESVESITPEKLSEWKSMLIKQRVAIFIPKFKLEPRYSMRDTLMEMGMPSAFTTADFSGMARGELWIGNVIHQAFIEVNEEGTEAAGATAVIVSRLVQTTPIFRADHPYIFIIQQKDTGNILFLGRVSDPTR